ncbi:MAG: hypothetical protein KAI91_05840 [Candidatus Omnitrophica bacterium]|nr:hypothetical protein [Candidatus Omnitrophota bacterium]MCK5289122.1 hypothetical protein [Candidatus Omnitrophota bacterium]MCK5393841.1 hypothetical protein [Candidatus Omnitrophota bacterium]
MEERGLKNNYIYTLIKFALFLLILCFLVELTKVFWNVLGDIEKFNLNILILSILSLFIFYNFIADLNNVYKKIQNFFFRSSFFSLLFPALLLALGLGYFFLPKILNLHINHNIFIFLGGFVFTGHLTFISRELKGHSFNSFINYLFIFSILYILNIVLFGLYLSNDFTLDMGEIVLQGMMNGAILIQNIFVQILR